jgi:hypothetical protein
MTSEQLVVFVKKRPLSVACAVVSIALLLSHYFRGGLISEAEAQLAEKSTQGERYASNIKNAAQLEEDLNQLTTATKEIDSRALRVNQLGINSQYFYKIEGESGVKLVDFRQTTQTAAKGKGAFTPIGFSVSVQGDLPQVLHFLRLLENGTHFCRVVTATVEEGGAASSATITLSLSLELLGAPTS